jgi:tRNA pseudouridine13 synthase
MYKIKQIPEDFVVEEVSDIIFSEGKFFCYKLVKRNFNTLSAIEFVAKMNNLRVSDFSFAGNKDRNALTSQIISVKKKIKNCSFKDIELFFLGNSSSPVSLGFLRGNDFKIVVRDIDEIPEIKREFVNFFGSQRFSVNNVSLGRALIKRDFEGFAKILGISVSGNNFVGAVSKVGKKMLSFYVHAYQSFIWNSAVELYLKENPYFDPVKKISIIGFGSDIDVFSEKILEKENISKRDFIIREIPDLSSEGTERFVWSLAENLKIGIIEDDDLNLGKKKVKIEFFLSKGSYATEFIKQNFS